MTIDDLNALVVDFEVLVYVEAGLIVKEELGASHLTHGRAFARVLYFGQEQRRGWAVFVGNQISCVL